MSWPKPINPFRYFHSSPEVIRLVTMMCTRFKLLLGNVDDLLVERGIDICLETVRHWWNRLGPMLATDIRRQRVVTDAGFRQWRRHFDEVSVKINSKTHCLWRAVDYEVRFSSPAPRRNATIPQRWRLSGRRRSATALRLD